MKIFTRQLRTLLIAVAAAVGAVGLAGCGDDSDSNEYVTIGGTKWMKKNLKTDNCTCYDNKPENCKKYGGLYTWEQAWSACWEIGGGLPSSKEWGELAAAVGGVSTAGKKLKAKSGWNSNGNGTDDYGFSAKPGGYKDTDGSFKGIDNVGYWWTDTKGSTGSSSTCSLLGSCYAYVRGMGSNTDNVSENSVSMNYSFSVRCVK